MNIFVVVIIILLLLMIIIIIIIIHRILTNNYSKIDWKQKSISDIKEKHNIIMSTFRGLDGKYFHLLDD